MWPLGKPCGHPTVFPSLCQPSPVFPASNPGPGASWWTVRIVDIWDAHGALFNHQISRSFFKIAVCPRKGWMCEPHSSCVFMGGGEGELRTTVLAKALFVLDSSLFVLLEFQWLDYWVRGQRRLLQQENVPDFRFRRVVPLWVLGPGRAVLVGGAALFHALSPFLLRPLPSKALGLDGQNWVTSPTCWLAEI